MPDVSFFRMKQLPNERAEWSLRNEAREAGHLLEQKMRGGVNGACGMNTTTPLIMNEKTELCKNRD